MFRSYELQVLSVRDYLSKTKDQQRELLPKDPGIYVWTIDLGHLALPQDPEDVPAPMFDRLRERMKPVEHSVSGRVGDYHKATLQILPKELTPSTRQRLEAIEQSGSPLIEWALLCGTLFQRPLYIGKAVSLRGRIRDHLRAGSRLRGYLESVQLDISACAVLLAVMTPPDDDTAELLEAAIDEQFPDEEEESADLLDDEDEELGADAPEPLSDADKLVRVAESLAIRLGQPLLNRKQD